MKSCLAISLAVLPAAARRAICRSRLLSEVEPSAAPLAARAETTQQMVRPVAPPERAARPGDRLLERIDALGVGKRPAVPGRAHGVERAAACTRQALDRPLRSAGVPGPARRERRQPIVEGAVDAPRDLVELRRRLHREFHLSLLGGQLGEIDEGEGCERLGASA
jgi:hypothetical protein